jgi:hypothetical protein
MRASGAVWREASFIHRITPTLRTGIVDNLERFGFFRGRKAVQQKKGFTLNVNP